MNNEIKQFAYAQLKSPSGRKLMLCNKVSSLGWQAGGFGSFNEQAKVVTTEGIEAIKSELDIFVKTIDPKAIIDDGKIAYALKKCPTLLSLIK